VTNQEDVALLKTLCKENQDPVPHIIVYPYAKTIYNDLEKDPRAYFYKEI